MEPALIGVGGTLAGTVLGAGLTWLLSKDATAKEREHQEAELIRQRREAAATALSGELEHLDDLIPRPATPAKLALPKLQEAVGQLQRCERRAALIEDRAIADRLSALSYALLIASTDAEEREAGDINVWSLGFAVADLNAAVDAFQLRKPPPDPLFPSPTELRDLIGDEPIGLPILNREMRMRRRAAWRNQPASGE